MQYLKDEVRKSIEREGLREFKVLGYNSASVRSIAKNANTSVGNFYKYFKGKEDLFEDLIGPVYERLIGYIRQFDEVELNRKARQIFYELMEKILEIFNENSAELSILFNKSSDSKYENCKCAFVDFVTRIVTETMKYELSLKGKRLRDNFIIYIVSHGFVEGIAVLLDKKEDGAEVRQLVLNMINIFYMDMVEMLDIEEL
jgi:AcrR family transcriptional regulator